MAETGYSSLEINTGNIAKLSLAWSLDLPGKSTREATPLAIDGCSISQAAYAAVYAVDATDTAASMHATAEGLADDARGQFSASGDAFSDAGSEIYNP